MKLSDLAREKCTIDPEITGLTADSRAVLPGYLFAALPGEKIDGAKFIPQAEQSGAAAILAKPGAVSALPMVLDEDPRMRLSSMAASFYALQPSFTAGVTGTNGKTSVTQFTAQLFTALGVGSGSIGTLGAQAKGFHKDLGFTTPEPVLLHQTTDELTRRGVSHLVMEVSSHGLAQHRADGIGFHAAAFSNITQDHLDFHETFDAYFAAKARLFGDLLRADGTAIINMDGSGAGAIAEIAQTRKLKVITTGFKGSDLKIEALSPHPGGLQLTLFADGKTYDLDLPLIGAFQAENALLAAGIVIAAGFTPQKVLPLLPGLKPVRGRMELAAEVGGASVFVDYAHTPDAIETALRATRPHARGRLIIIIGAGGDRDRTKRELMGRAAAQLADMVIVTDDNPRSEDPSAIRKGVIAGCPDALNIGDRAEAIREGINQLQDGDLLLIAGKGHETGQIVGGETLPFDDVEVARVAVGQRLQELGR